MKDSTIMIYDTESGLACERMAYKKKETTPQIKPFHVLGVSKGVKDYLLFQDEDRVIFPIGRHCVSYSILQRHTEFFHVTEGSMGIQALAISPDQRYLAVSEGSTITIYDLRDGYTKIEVLTASDYDVKEFVCLAFSPDSKYLISQAGGPTWSLFYWDWPVKEIISSIRATESGLINQVSCNPENEKQICVSGKGVLKIFELKQDSLTEIHSFGTEIDDFLCHTWVSGDSIVAGTESGRLLMLKSGCLYQLDNLYEGNKQTLDSSSLLAPPTMVSAIVRHPKGFACSFGPGLVCVYEETKEKGYRKTGTIRIPVDTNSKEPLQTITTMCVSPSGETLAIGTDRGQLYQISFRSVEISKNDKAEFSFLSHSFPSGSITCLSVCATKPLIATCSKDCTVHIWNYKSKSLVQFRQFVEEPLCVSIHPNGLYILVGFSTQVCLKNLVRDGMHTVRNYPIQNCSECVFNHDGSMFAVINKNKIAIVNVRTGEMKKLASNSKTMRSVKWSDDDTKLVSCGMDGYVYIWDVLTGICMLRHQTSSCYMDVTFSPNSESVIAVNRSSICEIGPEGIIFEMASDDVEYAAISVTHSGRAVFVGTAAGTVRVFNYPFDKEKTWKEHQAHSAPITKMVVTAGDQYLLSASEDGSLFIWSIIDQDGRTVEMVKDIDYSEEVLCTQEFLNKREEKINKLRQRVESLEVSKKLTVAIKKNNLNNQVESAVQNCLQEIEALEDHLQVLDAERRDQTLHYETKLTELKEQHTHELNNQRLVFGKKLFQKFQKHGKLKQKFQLMQDNFERKLKEAETRQLSTMEETKQAYEAKIQMLQAKLEQNIRDYEEQTKKRKDLTERKIMDLCLEFDQELETQKEMRLRAQCFKKKKESKILKLPQMKMVTESQSTYISEQKERIQKLKEQKQNVEKNKEDLEKQIEQQSKAIAVQVDFVQNIRKEYVVALQDSTIADLNKINDDLMLKIKRKEEAFEKELLKYTESDEERLQREEKERLEYESLVKEVGGNPEMYMKLCLKIKKRKEKYQEKIDKLKQELESSDKTLNAETLKFRDANRLLKKMKTDLDNCLSYVHEPKKLKKNFTVLYKHYMHNQTDVEMELDDRIVEELTVESEHMSKICNSQTLRQTDKIKTEKAKISKRRTYRTSLIKELQDEHHDHLLRKLRAGSPAISLVGSKRPAGQRQMRNPLLTGKSHHPQL